MSISRIVVAVDGSPGAARAVVWAAELARQTGAQVVALHARGLLAHDSHGDIAGPAPTATAVEEQLRCDWTAPLRAAGVSHDCMVREGDPVSVVLDAAEELDADVIVLGSRGLGGFPELLLGSTSTQVAQRAHRPVVIVPASDRPMGGTIGSVE